MDVYSEAEGGIVYVFSEGCLSVRSGSSRITSNHENDSVKPQKTVYRTVAATRRSPTEVRLKRSREMEREISLRSFTI